MIEPFKGELMLHPCALDYNANQCSNCCAYCFARNRNENRCGNPKSLVDLIYGRSNAKGLTRFLFDAGYAVCMSNRTDPLARCNVADSAVAFRAMNDAQNGLLIQTKGGSGREMESLDIVRKRNVCLYVSITSRDDGILGRVEPGAARYERRRELIGYALARGWAVIVGLNPLWRPWMPLGALEETVRELSAMGAKEYLIQPLHLPQAPSAACRSVLLPAEMEGSCRGNYDTPNGAYIIEAATLLKRLAGEIGIRWMPTFFKAAPAHMLDAASRALGKSMRSTQWFVDFAVESPRRFFTASDFVRVLTEGGNEDLLCYGARNVNGYLFCINRGAWKRDAKAKSAFGFVDVYRAIWNNPRFWPSPQNVMGRFRPLLDSSGLTVRDASGDLVLVKTEPEWEPWGKKAISLAELKGKGVNVDELGNICAFA